MGGGPGPPVAPCMVSNLPRQSNFYLNMLQKVCYFSTDWGSLLLVQPGYVMVIV